MNQDVTIIILSYNTKFITYDACLMAHLAANYCMLRLQNKVKIVLVDNGSKDGTVEHIRKSIPTIQIIANKKNLGTSQANNIGMERAMKHKSDFILLLNSDTFISEESIYKSIKFMEQNKFCDVMMAKLTTSNKQFRPYGGHLPTPFRLGLWSLGLESVPVLKRLLKPIYGYPRENYKLPFVVEWMPSCFYFLRSYVFKITGGFDDNIFFYMDDIEWCKRIKDSQLRIYFNPRVKAIHDGGESSKKKWDYKRIIANQKEGMSYYMEKHYGMQGAIALQIMNLGFRLRGIAYLLLGEKEKGLAYL